MIDLFDRYRVIEPGKALAGLVFGGLCHRLDFVCAESGAGWIPSLPGAFDWQRRNGGAAEEHPQCDPPPGERFRRWICACFWCERDRIGPAHALYPDNILYETDVPRRASLSPGPATLALPPNAPGALSEATLAKAPPVDGVH